MIRLRIALVLSPLLLLACQHHVAPGTKTPEGMKPWDEVVAASTKIDGVIPIRLRRDHAVLLDLHPSDLGRELGLALSLHRGSGTLDLIDGTQLGNSQLVVFRREGDKLYLVQKNPAARAPEGSGLALAVERDRGDSVVAAFPVIAEGSGGEVLADATDFLVSDYPNIAASLADNFPKPETRLSVDRPRSYVERVRGFPANVEIDTVVTYASANPDPRRIPLAADPRALTLGVRWSFFALPAVPMRPRLADDRIGYWVDSVRDYSRATMSNAGTDVDYLERWRLEKKDNQAAVSEPVQPIRYYLDPSIPPEYRGYVREGVLAWNRAFEAVGIRNAIVVEDAPADLDYADMRYSAIHWSTSYDQTYYAYGPHQVDPRTGEILNADVIFIADALPQQAEILRRHLHGCEAAAGAREQLRLARLASALRAPGGVDLGAQVGPLIRWLVMHEIGHTLGLRHNFRGSASTPYAKLDDSAWVEAHGLTASVMDYPPANIAADPKKQGHYFTPIVGDYDMFAIAYGYAPLYEQPATGPLARTGSIATTAEAERIGLAKLTQGVSDPMNAYAPDEDNWLGAWAVDPATSGWDLGDDPVAFSRQRLALLDEVTPHLADLLVEDGEPFAPLRDGVTEMFAERATLLVNVDKVIGGATVSRVHKGGGVPVVPVPPERQRAALALVLEQGFSERAFHVPAELLARTPPRRGHSIANNEQNLVPVDLPIHALVLAQQRTVLDDLLSPIRLRRIVDNQARSAPGARALTVSELTSSLTAGLFSELDASRPTVGTFRRNAQRLYVDALIALLWSAETKMPPLDNLMKYGDETSIPVPPPPEDARAAARHELGTIAERASKRAPNAADADTRAHLEEIASRITHALNTTFVIPAAAPPPAGH